MAGISEVLILVLIVICLLILPRFFKTDQIKTVQSRKKNMLSPGMRAFIIISIFLPAGTALVVKPWVHHFHWFVSIGILPVLLAWSIYWIIQGFKKR